MFNNNSIEKLDVIISYWLLYKNVKGGIYL